MNKVTLNVFLILILTSINCFSNPMISSVSDTTLIDNQSVTISGLSFGTKSTAAPLYYSDFDDETTGQVPTGWIEVNSGVTVSETLPYSGSKSLQVVFDNPDGEFSQIKKDLGSEIQDFYFTANIYFDKNDTCGAQWKSWRISSSSGAYSDSEESTTTMIKNNNWWRSDTEVWYNNAVFITYDGGNSYGGIDGNPGDMFLIDQWQRVEQFCKGSSAASTADGFLWTRRVGRAGNLEEITGAITYDSEDLKWRYLMLGQEWGQDEVAGACDGNVIVYYDNLYIDNTQARIEIGDNADYDSCTVREIQIPSAWSDTSATFTVNQGSFANGSTGYIHVIDDDGGASTGYGPVTFVSGESIPTASTVKNFITDTGGKKRISSKLGKQFLISN